MRPAIDQWRSDAESGKFLTEKVIRAVPPRTSASVHDSASARRSSWAAVAARYSDPESTWKYESRRATHCAVDDFPDAAGPSIAITT